jgi:multimeric flavodoxin WrbA
MKKIVAINASPRKGWNTDMIVMEAAKGAESAGAYIKKTDLYKIEKFTGCISCFGCKREKNLGQCIYKDGLAPVLEEIRKADGLIIGSPNYLGDFSAAFRSLYERLVFQYITYNTEVQSYNDHRIPVLLIMTSNAPDDSYMELMNKYKAVFDSFIGPTEILAVGETMQVSDYSQFNWTMFNAEDRKVKRETVFPEQCRKAFEAGVRLAAE